MRLLDCTLRDGGYYTNWDFQLDLIEKYLFAMKAAQIDVVEIGLRSLKNKGFKGPCAFTTDEFLDSLPITPGQDVSVMINGSELCTDLGCVDVLEQLFPHPASASSVQIVRFACHFHELPNVLPAAGWLSERGYRVGFNLMQIADRTKKEVTELSRMASDWPIEVLYFADSMGSMTPDEISSVIGLIRSGWDGELGIHTHDNMGLALANTLRAHAEGVTWLDATVTGMGRGPGNARMEELVIEAETLDRRRANLVPLMSLIRNNFASMKAQHQWGTNPYYYYAGKYGIHPTFIQEMMGDTRYDEHDILAVIAHLRTEGGKKFSLNTLGIAREFFYNGTPGGSWKPSEMMEGRDILILGTGPGVATYRKALEAYVLRANPLVIALNTQEGIETDLIDLRIACHPVRLLADAETHSRLSQPLITPASQLPDFLLEELGDKEMLDFGLGISSDRFEFHETHCFAPTSLVLAYSLSVATSGKAKRVLMAGFDGYPAGDSRNDETAAVLDIYRESTVEDRLISVTPTCHQLQSVSIYASNF